MDKDIIPLLEDANDGQTLCTEAIDLETFRANLHKMIEEVYAEP